MKLPIITMITFATLVCASVKTHADEIEFYCDGFYDSKTTADN